MKKLPILCILAGIALIVYLIFSLLGIYAKSMPEETLDNDWEETYDSVVSSVMLDDIRIFLRSPRCSALHAAAEYNLDSIEVPNVDGTLNVIRFAISNGLVRLWDVEETLNDIRFAGWTDDDLFCNDYLRAFRRYLDTWLQGKKIDETEADPSALEPYRERLSGKFFALHVREIPFGGLQYRLFPIDDASLILKVWIYSVVDDDGHINEYQVQHIEVNGDLKKEMIMSIGCVPSRRKGIFMFPLPEDTEEPRTNLW